MEAIHFGGYCQMREYRVPEIVLGFGLGIIGCLFVAGITSHSVVTDFLTVGFFTGVFTFFLVVSNLALWSAANKQIALSRDDFSATHRPWVSVSVAIGPRGLYFDVNGANLHLLFVCKNTGATPAVGVWVEVQPFLQRQGRVALEEQRRACDGLRARPYHPRAPETTIFPGDLARFDFVYSFKGREDLEREAAERHGFVSPVVVGCVDYMFPFGERAHHQTRFIYDLHKINVGGARLAIRLDEGNVAPENLRLENIFSQGSAFFAD